MRIAYGVSALTAAMQRGNADGIGNVARELLQRLHLKSDLDVLPFEYARQATGQIPTALAVGSFQPQAALSLLTGASFTVMQRRLHGRVDLVHATDHYIPRLRGIPVLATLMDAIPLSHPEWVAYRLKSIKNEAWRRSAHWATHILTISEFSRQEIARWFRVPEERISVAALGVDNRWFTTHTEAEQNRVRVAYALPQQFFLFVGTLQPRKNLEHLIRAHALLPADVRSACPLIIVGRKGWGCDALFKRLNAGQEPDVRWLSYLPAQDLPVVLSLATALAFPSLYEGFGLPILESFASGTPVIASSTTSIPEVAGDAALLVDPRDVHAWVEAMNSVVTNEVLASQMRIRGRMRALQFTWDRSADQLVQLYERIASH